MPTKTTQVRHKKPKGNEPSALVLHFAEVIAQNSPGPVADVACGYGRNALYLGERGCSVYCLDNNAEALATIANLSPKTGQLYPVLIDLQTEAWPFKSDALNAVINVHYFRPELLPQFIESLISGGYLLIETIENRGQNYLSLPKQNFILDQLKDSFEILLYQEKKAGPEHQDAVTAKVFARKQ